MSPDASSAPLPRWDHMTSAAAAALVDRDPVAVLPLAAVEQHGSHLPLGTDLLLGTALLERAWALLPDDFPLLALPPQAVGTSREHLRFPGTLSLDPGELGAVVEALGADVARAGVRRLVLHNSHGGNRDVLHGPALRLRDEHGLLVVKSTYFRFPRPDGVDFPEEEWRHGFHGGAVETAMMLHLHPELVDSEALPDAESLGRALEEEMELLGPEGTASFAWLAGDLHPGGTVGNARLAHAEAGRRLVEGYAASLARLLREARAFPLERLRG